MAGSGSGQEVYEMILEHPVPADSKEAIRDSWGPGSQLEEALPAAEGTIELL